MGGVGEGKKDRQQIILNRRKAPGSNHVYLVSQMEYLSCQPDEISYHPTKWRWGAGFNCGKNKVRFLYIKVGEYKMREPIMKEGSLVKFTKDASYLVN